MIGIKFGIKHSYRDFGMYLTKKEISLPKAKTEKVSVTGRDGDIDLTEALGDNVRFKNRTLKFTFTTVDYKKWAQSLSAVANYLHGQKMQIIMDADPQYYYYGRCSINQFETNKATGKIVIECDVEPYKIEVNGPYEPWQWDPFSFVDGVIRDSEITVATSATVNLINKRKIVSPTFICSKAMTVTFGGTTYNLTSGENKVLDIRLQEGDNPVVFKCSGTGTVKIRYKGGSL